MERYVGKHQKEPGHRTRDTGSPVDIFRSPGASLTDKPGARSWRARAVDDGLTRAGHGGRINYCAVGITRWARDCPRACANHGPTLRVPRWRADRLGGDATASRAGTQSWHASDCAALREVPPPYPVASADPRGFRGLTGWLSTVPAGEICSRCSLRCRWSRTPTA